MELLIIASVLCALWRVSLRLRGYHEGYLAPSASRAVKGILTMFVVWHHFSQDIDGRGLLFVFRNMGILCVSLFFFFSGYGLYKSYLAKPDYPRQLLHRRIPGLYLQYLLATLIYTLEVFLLGDPLPLPSVLGAVFLGKPVSGLLWYIYCLLFFYILFWAAARIFRKRPLGMVALLAVGAVAWVVICRKLGYMYFWYNTVITFPLGVAYAIWEQKLLPRLQKCYWLALPVSFAVFAVFYVAAIATTEGMEASVGLYWSACAAFLMVMVLLLMKLRFGNPILNFLGDHSLEIYVMHPIFISLFHEGPLPVENPVLRCIVIFAVSILSAWMVHRLSILLQRVFLPKS